MKRIVIILVLLHVGLSSCTVQKRKYFKGYYISWHHRPDHGPLEEEVVLPFREDKASLTESCRTGSEAKQVESQAEQTGGYKEERRPAKSSPVGTGLLRLKQIKFLSREGALDKEETKKSNDSEVEMSKNKKTLITLGILLTVFAMLIFQSPILIFSGIALFFIGLLSKQRNNSQPKKPKKSDYKKKSGAEKKMPTWLTILSLVLVVSFFVLTVFAIVFISQFPGFALVGD